MKGDNSQARDTRPLLNRLQPSVRITDLDLQATMPRIGAGATVYDLTGTPYTVWLPTAAWQGIATLIRSTPQHCREDVATFLEILDGSLTVGTPLSALLNEVIREVRHDSHGELPQDSLDSHDFAW